MVMDLCRRWRGAGRVPDGLPRLLAGARLRPDRSDSDGKKPAKTDCRSSECASGQDVAGAVTRPRRTRASGRSFRASAFRLGQPVRPGQRQRDGRLRARARPRQAIGRRMGPQRQRPQPRRGLGGPGLFNSSRPARAGFQIIPLRHAGREAQTSLHSRSARSASTIQTMPSVS
jgi:hypothetical protein